MHIKLHILAFVKLEEVQGLDFKLKAAPKEGFKTAKPEMHSC